jgi:hypothetical protein
VPQVHDEPSDVRAEKGIVIVDGPDGVAVSLTPEAAIRTGAKLIDQAAVAKGDAEIEASQKSRSNGA